MPQQQQNQSANQGPAIRTMAPTGPPTQASTPPNSEMKVQQMAQPGMTIVSKNILLNIIPDTSILNHIQTIVQTFRSLFKEYTTS